MQPRRSKVVPDPLLYPDGTAAAHTAKHPSQRGSSAGSAVADGASRRGTAPQRPRLFNAAAAASPVLSPRCSAPGGAVELASPGLNVYAAAGSSGSVACAIAPKRTVRVADHVTNTGAVVRLEQLDYSKALRAYRVCRQEGGLLAEEQHTAPHALAAAQGTPLSPTHATSTSRLFSPTSTAGTASSAGANTCTAAAATLGHCPASWRVVFVRLFGAADMVLLAVALACFLVVVSRFNESEARRSPSWLTSVVSAVVSGGAMRRPSRGAAASSTPEAAAVVLHRSPHAPLGSYQQVTSVPAFDSSVTCVLLLLSTLLLAKRLTGALTQVYVEEVLVMRGVGLQLSAYGLRNTLRYRHFVDLLMLRSLVIHDAFVRYQPMFFLSSSVENCKDRVVLFPNTLPRLAVLRPVLNGVRAVLYGEPEEGPSLAEMEERTRTADGDQSDGDLFTEDSFAEDTVTTPDNARSSSSSSASSTTNTDSGADAEDREDREGRGARET
ncbi:GPI-GlcNAc transferase complex, PIG-H component [Novymonas esmeraldas]|uniref:GPI-GlcNAc transferase complex, PIG-H component n=1 Tax=Novymonas esmeraldas TaxID=1808958 RepID=A0AAW0FBH6_9TRYP